MQKCEGDIREAVQQDVKLCNEEETVSEFTYLVTGRVSVEDVRLL